MTPGRPRAPHPRLARMAAPRPAPQARNGSARMAWAAALALWAVVALGAAKQLGWWTW